MIWLTSKKGKEKDVLENTRFKDSNPNNFKTKLPLPIEIKYRNEKEKNINKKTFLRTLLRLPKMYTEITEIIDEWK